MKHVSVFVCAECNAATILSQAPKDLEREDDEVQPLGFCGLVRETHAENDGAGCTGTVEFIGSFTLGGAS